MPDLHRDYFNRLAPEWNAMMPDVPRLGEYLSRFGVCAGEWVLDVGTGTGRTASMLSERVGSNGRVFALDFAERMLLEARKMLHRSNVQYLCADASMISLRNDSLDKILVFSAFPHIREPLKAIQEMARILKKDGRLLILHACSSKTLNQFHTSLSGAVSQDVLPNADEMMSRLRDCGFKEKTAFENDALYWVEGEK